MSGDYKSSMHFVDSCLKIAPELSLAIALKKSIEDRMNNDNDAARFVGDLVCYLLSSKK